MAFWLTRIVLLRSLGFLFMVAFFIAYLQNEYLIGEKGLTPAIHLIDRIFKRSTAVTNNLFSRLLDPYIHSLFLSHPTIFWYISPTSEVLNNCAMVGLVLSALICILGSANVIILFIIWILYLSIVNVGQTWYSFGWESQLLESGILAILTVPIFSLERFPRYTPTSAVSIWGFRYLLFRIMIGAGLIKIRGDPCWRDLTCLNYHYETQPVPNPLSIYFHHNPEFFHKFETLGNHFFELICPWLLLVPMRSVLIIGGLMQIIFQFVLILTGNYAFLNWLTIVPAIMCFDDKSLSLFFTKQEIQFAKRRDDEYESILLQIGWQPRRVSRYFNPLKWVDAILQRYFTRDFSQWSAWTICGRRLLSVISMITIGYLSLPVMFNLISPQQQMNVSYDPFRIVNSYGLFGSITKVRNEVIIQGTLDQVITPQTIWKDFEFPCKPGDINRTPCVITPYHLRMDWLLWFAAFQSYQHCPWIIHLADKLLNGDPTVFPLLAASEGHPFRIDSSNQTVAYESPTFIRAELYEYRFPSLHSNSSSISSKKRSKRNAEWEIGKWWKRKHVRSYSPAIEKNNPTVKEFLERNGMKKVG